MEKRKRTGKTIKEKIIDGYDGDLRATAERAGSTYGYAKQVVMSPEFKAMIRERDEKEERVSIASRQERQKWWTAIMRGEVTTEKIKKGSGDNPDTVLTVGLDFSERLKASELLGRSECDFSEKRILEGGDKPIGVTNMPASVAGKLDELYSDTSE